MSKVDNKQLLIHIVCEIVVAIGIIFFFSQKTKKLASYIDDLSHRLEDQEDIIKTHEQLINKLLQSNGIQSNECIKPTITPSVPIKPCKADKGAAMAEALLQLNSKGKG